MGVAEVIHQTGKAVFCLIINFLDLLSIWIRCLKYHLLKYFISTQMMQGKGFSRVTLIGDVLNVAGMEASRASFSELRRISQNAWFTSPHIYTKIPSKVHYLHQLVQGKGYVGVCMGVLAFGWGVD